jgi:hypothetical protein
MQMNSRKIEKPTPPKDLTEESVAAYKASLRHYDRSRVATNQVSAQEVQRENAIFRPPVSFRVLTFPVARAR